MKWEHKTIKIKATGAWVGGKVDEGTLDRMMNELGADGWELVSAVSANEGFGNKRDLLAIFKRQA